MVALGEVEDHRGRALVVGVEHWKMVRAVEEGRLIVVMVVEEGRWIVGEVVVVVGRSMRVMEVEVVRLKRGEEAEEERLIEVMVGEVEVDCLSLVEGV